MNVSRFRIAFATLLAVAALVAPGLAWAQVDTGSVDGRVFDETRAAVPGASINARNQATGLTRSAITTANGTYRIGALPAGLYELTADLTGFAKQVRKDVAVQIGTTPTVDFTMSVSSQTETVEVVGEAALVQTSASDVGQVISEKLVDNLPLNGRKFQDLSLLVPGTRNSNYYDPTKTEEETAEHRCGHVYPACGCNAAHRVVRAVAEQRPVLGIQLLLEQVETGSAVVVRPDALDHLGETVGSR